MQTQAIILSYQDQLRALVENRIASAVRGVEPEYLRSVLCYATHGGKRVRPLLTMLACGAAGGIEEQAVGAAAAVELLHTSSLIHDDIMDGATLVERVFYADTYDANWPDTPWTYWSWTANSTGTYTLVARVVNIGDSEVSSYMGFDIAETIPSTVYEIDSESGVVLNSFPARVGIDYGLYGLGFSSARNTLFLGFYESNMIYEVDPDTGEVVNAFAGPEGAGISALAADECGVAPSAPKADFHASNTTVCANVTIDFIDDSTGTYHTWYWDFGDGSNSTEENPSHTYTTAGNYTVSLTVSDGYGDDTETKVDYITVVPSPEANFEANVTMACAGVTFNFTKNSTDFVPFQVGGIALGSQARIFLPFTIMLPPSTAMSPLKRPCTESFFSMYAR